MFDPAMRMNGREACRVFRPCLKETVERNAKASLVGALRVPIWIHYGSTPAVPTQHRIYGFGELSVIRIHDTCDIVVGAGSRGAAFGGRAFGLAFDTVDWSR
jgi:hypothetical protein